MAKVILDAPFRRIKGKIRKLSYRWMYGQQTVVKTPDMSRVKWSKAQKANRQRFAQAIHYAKQAMSDPKPVHSMKSLGRKPAATLPCGGLRLSGRQQFAGRQISLFWLPCMVSSPYDDRHRPGTS